MDDDNRWMKELTASKIKINELWFLVENKGEINCLFYWNLSSLFFRNLCSVVNPGQAELSKDMDTKQQIWRYGYILFSLCPEDASRVKLSHAYHSYEATVIQIMICPLRNIEMLGIVFVKRRTEIWLWNIALKSCWQNESNKHGSLDDI